MTFSGRPSPDSIATMICGTTAFRSGLEGMISTCKHLQSTYSAVRVLLELLAQLLKGLIPTDVARLNAKACDPEAYIRGQHGG